MSRTVNNLRKNKYFKHIMCVVVLLAMAATYIMSVKNDDSSHAAESISIELDGNIVNPSDHIQMTTSSITLVLRSNDNIYSDPSQYKINWTIESEQHQKRAKIEKGSSDVFGILTALQPGEVQVQVNVVDKSHEELGVIASASCWVDIIFSVDTVHDDNNFKYVYDTDPSRSLIMHTDDPSYQLSLAFGEAKNCQWTTDNEEVVEVDMNGRVTPVGAGRTDIIVTYTPTGDIQTYTARLPVFVFPKISLDGTHFFSGGTYGMATGDVIYTDAFFGANNTETIQEKLLWVIKKDVNGVRTVIEDSVGNKQSDLVEITPQGGVSNTSDLVINAKAGNYYIEFYPAGTYESEAVKTAISPTVLNLTVYANLGNFDKTIIVNDAFNLADSFNMTETDFNDMFSRPVITLSGGGDASNYISYASDSTIITSLQKGTVLVSVKPKSGKEDNVRNMANPKETVNTSEMLTTLRIIDSFTLDRTSVVMYKGQSIQLTPTFTSYSGIVSWSTSDDKTVKVSEGGLISALKETAAGSDVTITATLKLDDGTIKKATCIVRVEPSIDKISINPDKVTMEKGTTTTLLAKFSGNVTVAPFTWRSTNPKICSVTAAADGKSCLVNALNGGEATIVLTNNDNMVQVYCTVTVTVPIEKLALKDSTVEAKLYTEGMKLNYSIQPTNATDLELIWKSSDEKVATVDSTGLVTFVGPGTTLINVYPKNNPYNTYSQCMLTVIQTAESMTLSVNEVTIYAGDTYNLTYTVQPENSDLNVTFSSANADVATVDANGLITAKKAGFTQIFAKGEGLDAPSVCSVSVLQRSKSLAFSQKEIVVRTGEKVTPTVNLSPVDSTDKIEWLSLDTKVATVDNGVITGVSSGSTYVQAKAESGADAMITVYVRDPVSGLALDKGEVTIGAGETIKLNPVFTPANPYDQTVKWSTSNGGIVTVDNEGNVTAQSGGVAVIKCVSNDGGYQAICIVTVNAPPTPTPAPPTATPRPPVSMTLNYKSYNLGIGKKVLLKPTAVNVTNPQYKWKSSNKKIATVNKKGRVTGKKLGKCKITATMVGEKGIKASCTIRVVRKVTSIKLSRNMATVLVGNTFKLTKTVKPRNASIKGVSWSSADTLIATVDDKGNVFGVAPGIVKITATAKDGSKKNATCIVTVKEKVPATGINPPDSEITIAVGTAKTVGFQVAPDNSTDNIVYTTDNQSVVGITAKGKIYGRSIGTATVYATTTSGATGSVDVKVVGMNRSTLTIRPYDKHTLWVNGIDSGVKWYAENPLIASVDDKGEVIGRKVGSTRIYAIADGTKLSCVVRVTKLK